MLRQEFGARWQKVQEKKRQKVLLVGGPAHRTKAVVDVHQDTVEASKGNLYRRFCKNDQGVWLFEYVEEEPVRGAAPGDGD